MPITFFGSATAGNTNGATATLTLPSSAVVVGNQVVVLSVVSRTGSNQTVTSSTGAIYSTVQAPVASTSALASLAVFSRRIISTGEITVSCSGTGNIQDVTMALAYIYQDSNGAPTLSANSTTSAGTTPNSPAVTAQSSSTVVISGFGAGGADTTVTAPTSYLNALSTTRSDTRTGTAAMAWVTVGTAGSFDPTGWSGLTSASWVAVSVAINPAPTWWAPEPFGTPKEYSVIEVVGY